MIKHSFSACCKKHLQVIPSPEKEDWEGFREGRQPSPHHSGADGGGHEEDLVEVDEVDHDVCCSSFCLSNV